MSGSMPEAFLSRMRQQLGDELPAFLYAMEEEPPVRGIRMNPDKPAKAADKWKSGDPVPWEKNGWYLEDDGSAPGNTIWHEAGAFYLQDPAAMIPVNVLDPQPGEFILDLCAAPGGKSTQIGIAMQGSGLLVCNEPVPKRAQVLSRNLERMGICNAAAVCAAPGLLAAKWPQGFDAVLVDAPCSGEGMFRRYPETRNEWSAGQAEGCAIRQREILEEAAGMVRPGGRMVYSTCTFNPAENEENTEWFLREHPEWEPEAFRLPETDGRNGSFLCLPHRTRGEGQFVALLRKKGSGSACLAEDRYIPKAGEKEREQLRQSFPELPDATHRFGNGLVSIPFCPEMKGIRCLRLGLHLGECREKLAVPDHACAWVAAKAGRQITGISPADAVRYMAGETVNGNETGWTVVSCEGSALGWGKGSGGVIKNHYPKGLRKSRLGF